MRLCKTCVHCILYAVFFAKRGGCSGSSSPPLLGTLLVLSAVIGSIIIYNDLMCSLGRGLQCRYRIIRRNITRHTRRQRSNNRCCCSNNNTTQSVGFSKLLENLYCSFARFTARSQKRNSEDSCNRTPN